MAVSNNKLTTHRDIEASSTPIRPVKDMNVIEKVITVVNSIFTNLVDILSRLHSIVSCLSGLTPFMESPKVSTKGFNIITDEDFPETVSLFDPNETYSSHLEAIEDLKIFAILTKEPKIV